MTNDLPSVFCWVSQMASCSISCPFSSCRKFISANADPYLLKKHEHHGSLSIGVSLFRGNEQSVDVLFQQADLAMYQAKSSGLNAVRFFDEVMQHNVSVHADLVHDLRLALELAQLHLYFQMQVDDHNRPLGAEAL